jgi:hypothetical protein
MLLLPLLSLEEPTVLPRLLLPLLLLLLLVVVLELPLLPEI